MQNDEAISRLNALLISRHNLIKAYQRKRSLRNSERATAIADVLLQVEALHHAISVLQKDKET